MDRSASRPVRRLVPGTGHRVPRGDGGARPLSAALAGMRGPGSAHRPRRERDELLPALPDRRPTARRPRAVATPARRLAAHAGADGGLTFVLAALARIIHDPPAARAI